MGQSKKKKDSSPILAKNKRARHDYEILEEVEVGLELVGSEVKSLRNRSVQFQDAFAEFRGDQLYLMGVTISPYLFSNQFNHVPDRARRILMHRHELDRWRGKVEQKRLTIVPLDIHMHGRWIKMQLALARGMKEYDKRHALKEAQDKRDVDRAMKEFNQR